MGETKMPKFFSSMFPRIVKSCYFYSMALHVNQIINEKWYLEFFVNSLPFQLIIIAYMCTTRMK